MTHIKMDFKLGENSLTPVTFYYSENEITVQKGNSDKNNNFDESIIHYMRSPGGSFSWLYNVLFQSEEFFKSIHENKELSCAAKHAIMDRFLFAFEYTGIKYIKKPWLYEKLTKLIYDYSNNEIYKPYLRTCLNESNEAFFKNEIKQDREKAVREIIFRNGKVQQNIIDDDDGVTHERIIQWLLKNYDLMHLKLFETALGLHGLIYTDTEDGGTSSGDGQSDRQKKWYFCKKTALLVNQNSKSLMMVLLPLFFLLFIYSTGYPHALDQAISIRWITGIWLVIICSLLMLDGFFNRPSLLLRMIGCILAGYIAISADEAISDTVIIYYGELHAKSLWSMLLRWIILGGFAYFYLNREIRNRIQHTSISKNFLKRIVRQKAFTFWCRAAGYSLILGVFISDFFYDSLLTRNIAVYKKLKVFENAGMSESSVAWESFPNIPFLLGHVYPDAILIQAPLALFIGIFINLLWEDKALTAPI